MNRWLYVAATWEDFLVPYAIGSGDSRAKSRLVLCWGWGMEGPSWQCLVGSFVGGGKEPHVLTNSMASFSVSHNSTPVKGCDSV